MTQPLAQRVHADAVALVLPVGNVIRNTCSSHSPQKAWSSSDTSVYIDTDPSRKSDLSNQIFISTGLPDLAIS